MKARGFSNYLYKFETLVLLELTILSLEKVEALNETIQATKVNFKTVIKRVNMLNQALTLLELVRNSMKSGEK